MANKKERCPKCEAWVTGLPVHDDTVDQLAKVGAGLVNGLTFGVGGTLLNQSGATTKASHWVQDQWKGKVKFHFECGCGYEWDKSYNLNEGQLLQDKMTELEKWNKEEKRKKEKVRVLERELAAAETVYKQAKSKSIKSFFWMLLFGGVDAYLIYYCWTEPFLYHVRENVWLLGERDVENYHWSWLGMFILAIICTVTFFNKFNAWKSNNSSVSQAKNNHETLPCKLEQAKRDYEEHLKSKPVI